MNTMADLLAFDDDDSNLFVPAEGNKKKQTSRSIDDIFGTNDNDEASNSTLDDILTSQPGDDIFSAPQKKPNKKTDSQKIDDLFGAEDDDGFDFFTSGNKTHVPKEGTENDISLDSLLINVNQSDSSSKSHERVDNSLDLLLDIQPEGTVTASGNLMSLIDTAVESSDKHTTDNDSLFDEQKPAPETDESLISLLDKNKTLKIDGVSHGESDDSLDMLLDTQPPDIVPSFNNVIDSNNDAEGGSFDASKDRNISEEFVVVSPFDTCMENTEYESKDTTDLLIETTNESKDKVGSHEQVTSPTDKPEDVWDGGVPHEESNDSLDMLLDAQPEGTVSVSDTLRSIMDTSTSNKDSPGETTDPLDDFFGSSGDTDQQPGEVIEENPREETPEPVLNKPITNLKKSMERSFEDLLTGLSDESEPELDDMIEDGNDNTNLERYRHNRSSKSLLQTPNKSVADTSISSYDSSPSKSINPPRDMDQNKDSLLQDYDFCSLQPQEPANPPEVRVHESDSRDRTDSLDLKSFEVLDNEKESEVAMRHRNGSQRSTSEGEDIDLSAIRDTTHLDVDVNKHKSELGKKGSMALRRKPSRKNRRSLMSTGDDAIFPDNTETSSPGIMNGEADDDDMKDTDQDAFDMSPPAKKHSPAGMVPLPGFPTRPPPRLSSDNQEEDMEETPKEAKRISKPPPGAFKLPAVIPRQLKTATDTPTTSRRTEENTTQEFVKPTLRSTKRDISPSPALGTSGEKTGFETPVLRKTGNQGGRARLGSSEERDMTFEKPALRSTPKPNIDRPTKSDEPTESFEPRMLRSTPKREMDSKTDSDKHTFEKPKLKTTGRPLVIDQQKTESNTNQSARTFDKPVLRSAKKDRSDSTGDKDSGVTHAFEKPSLRNTPSRLVDTDSNKKDQFTSGVFDKPSLKKTTPSPEKEVKSVSEPKGTFDKPSLRRTEGSKVQESKSTTAEKPSWLQTAAEKQTKALGALHTKENNHVSNDKPVPSWLESPRQTGGTMPLQEASTNKQDAILSDSSSKSSTPRSRESSISGDTNSQKKYSTGSKTGVSNNYSPAWMRQGRSPSSGAVTGMTGLQAAISCPTLTTDEVPQWKRELAQRRMSKKDSPSVDEPEPDIETEEGIPKKDEPKEPEWKRNIQLRKVSTRSSPSKETQAIEPEWMKKAEEKKARLRKSAKVDPSES